MIFIAHSEGANASPLENAALHQQLRNAKRSLVRTQEPRARVVLVPAPARTGVGRRRFAFLVLLGRFAFLQDAIQSFRWIPRCASRPLTAPGTSASCAIALGHRSH